MWRISSYRSYVNLRRCFFLVGFGKLKIEQIFLRENDCCCFSWRSILLMRFSPLSLSLFSRLFIFSPFSFSSKEKFSFLFRRFWKYIIFINTIWWMAGWVSREDDSKHYIAATSFEHFHHCLEEFPVVTCFSHTIFHKSLISLIFAPLHSLSLVFVYVLNIKFLKYFQFSFFSLSRIFTAGKVECL